MDRVWEFSRASGTPLIVLLCLADWADDAGECWPSVDTIAKKARLKDVRHVRRVIHDELETKLGEVVVIPNGGRAGSKGGLRSNRYRITVHMPEESGDSGSLTPITTGDRGCGTPPDSGSQTPQTLADGPPEPSSTRQGEPSKTLVVFADDFAAVWDAYPRKLERGKAARAYTARRRAGVSAEDLLAACRNYAAATIGSDPKFIKLGATFFGPDQPFADFVHGIPEGAMPTNTQESKSMAAIEAATAMFANDGQMVSA